VTTSVCGRFLAPAVLISCRPVSKSSRSDQQAVTRCGGRPSTSYALLGYPRSRNNGGHSGGATQCSPVLLHREYPRERPWFGSGTAYGARQSLRRAESQRAGEDRERSGVEAPRPNMSFAPLGYPRREMPGGHEHRSTIPQCYISRERMDRSANARTERGVNPRTRTAAAETHWVREKAVRGGRGTGISAGAGSMYM